jgi:glycerate kinase
LQVLAGVFTILFLSSPMILLAPDSFKGSLSALEACAWMERGVRAVPALAASTCRAIPLADGGEATLEAVERAAGGARQFVQVLGPLGDSTRATWLQLDSNTALLEMAQSSGLTLVEASRRDTLRATSFGLGQAMRAALDAGCRHLIIGLGGSATTDGASGALAALGARMLDRHGQVLARGGAALQSLAAIDLSGLDARLRECEVEVLCDVSNPLCGPNGAAHIFGPQKAPLRRACKYLTARCNASRMSRRKYLGATCATTPAPARPAAPALACWRFATRA